jgi:flagellar hook-associated protein 2
MSGISTSGLASGMDWKTTVDQLIAADSTPLTTAKADKTANTTKIAVLSTIKDDLTALKTSADALNNPDDFNERSANIADSSSTWSATAASGTATGDYVFEVSQLATKTGRTGSANMGAPISSSSTVTGVTLGTMNLGTAITAGSFTVNGTKIDLALTDSLASVLKNISDKTSAAVTATYNSTSDTISLSSTSQITLGSANDTSNFLTALKLYNSSETGSSGSTYTLQSTGKLGVPVLSATLENAKLKTTISNVDKNGNGTFSINGVPISFNTKTDSVQAVIDRINGSTAGVVTTYDKSADKFALTNQKTGNLGMSISETAGGFLEALGLNSTATLSSGKNATLTVNGGNPLTSTDNHFTTDITGITGLSVTATSTGSQTVNVAPNSTNATSKLNDFITKYNAAQDYIAEQTKITTGTDGKVTTATLASDHDISDISSKLRGLVFSSVSGLTGSIKRLADIGIDFQSDSSDLEITDANKLDKALTNNASDVATLFDGSSGGLVSIMDAYVTKFTDSGVTLPSKTTSLNAQNDDLDTQIDRLNTQLDAKRTRLTNSFVQMETAQSSLKNQLSYLQNAFKTSSS